MYPMLKLPWKSGWHNLQDGTAAMVLAPHFQIPHYMGVYHPHNG